MTDSPPSNLYDIVDQRPGAQQLVQAPSVSNILPIGVNLNSEFRGSLSPSPFKTTGNSTTIGEPRLDLNPFRPTIGISPGPSPQKVANSDYSTSKLLPARALAAVRDILARGESQYNGSTSVNPVTTRGPVRSSTATVSSQTVAYSQTVGNPKHDYVMGGTQSEPVTDNLNVLVVPKTTSESDVVPSSLNISVQSPASTIAPLNPWSPGKVQRPSSSTETVRNPGLQSLLHSNPVAFLKSQTPVKIKDPLLAELAAARLATNSAIKPLDLVLAQQAVEKANLERKKSVEEKVMKARAKGGFKKAGRNSDGSPMGSPKNSSPVVDNVNRLLESGSLGPQYTEAGTQTVEEISSEDLYQDNGQSELVVLPGGPDSDLNLNHNRGNDPNESGGSELGITVNSAAENLNTNSCSVNSNLPNQPVGVQSLSVGTRLTQAQPSATVTPPSTVTRVNVIPGPSSVKLVSPILPMPSMPCIAPRQPIGLVGKSSYPVSLGLLQAAASRQTREAGLSGRK